jgi:CRISPR-associated protein Cmx8
MTIDRAVESDRQRELARRVRGMSLAYVMRRTEQKAGMSLDEARTRGGPPPVSGTGRAPVAERYRDAREKVCTDAFLSMRSCRTREDFVTFFTGTICAEPQFLPESDYYTVAEALLARGDRWEDVKALAMLAVSSLSNV